MKELLLHTNYQYKVYTDNSIIYKIQDGMKFIGKLGFSYLNGYDSDRLYIALRDLKRIQLDDNGLSEISEKDHKKIEEEKNSYGSENLTVILAKSSLGAELKLLDDKLLIIPKVDVLVKFANKMDDFTFNYKDTNVKVGLNVDYRW